MARYLGVNWIRMAMSGSFSRRFTIGVHQIARRTDAAKHTSVKSRDSRMRRPKMEACEAPISRLAAISRALLALRAIFRLM